MSTINLTIDGMNCGHCVKAVQQALEAVPGVKVESVAIGSATVHADGDPAPIAQIKEAIEDAGYVAQVA